eukprot:CAMPEP_0204293796 /NCGR_PEP_ID=MMETSP0468-20130131/66821_1 /ASSEMBLY_ACC=CAM_ASM_000383 /TAXON_ID=2969 /ORGANISM="Oxyrrhis marina" /LENGTH=162 /DNA_ID=CAMNT_0051272287 /DNA_START=781 /DNA_END=1269 /DNA_ORIENTATION=+
MGDLDLLAHEIAAHGQKFSSQANQVGGGDQVVPTKQWALLSGAQPQTSLRMVSSRHIRRDATLLLNAPGIPDPRSLQALQLPLGCEPILALEVTVPLRGCPHATLQADCVSKVLRNRLRIALGRRTSCTAEGTCGTHPAWNGVSRECSARSSLSCRQISSVA